jgi:hypothetical protein
MCKARRRALLLINNFLVYKLGTKQIIIKKELINTKVSIE